MQREQLFKFIQKIQKFFESLPSFFVLFVILLIVLGITIGSLLPPRVTSILYIFLSILLPIAASALIGFFAKESTKIKQEYEKKVEDLQNCFNQTLKNYTAEKQLLLEQLNLLREVIGNSFKVLCFTKDRINDEIKYLIENSILIEFFGNFNKQYQKVLNNYKGRIIICDTQPEEDLLSYGNYEYRFLYYKFNFDLLVFHYQNHDRKSMLIFPDRNEAWVVNFDLARNLELRYEEFPLFHLKEQITDQIRCAETSSPIVEKANYRKHGPLPSKVHEEFSLVLQTIEKGYTKPIFPPTDIDTVIRRWNEKIFLTFVDYATTLLENADEVLITWLIDIDYPQTIELYSIFQPWITKLNTEKYTVKRVILIDKQDLSRNDLKIQIRYNVYKDYSSVVQYLVNQVILKDLTNPNYVYCFANISSPHFPILPPPYEPDGYKKDFAVFRLKDKSAIIQTSELDIEDRLLRLFFRLPKDENELNLYLDFFNNCFRDPPPSYVYKDLNSALKI
jgi:hypothetical protein